MRLLKLFKFPWCLLKGHKWGERVYYTSHTLGRTWVRAECETCGYRRDLLVRFPSRIKETPEAGRDGRVKSCKVEFVEYTDIPEPNWEAGE